MSSTDPPNTEESRIAYLKEEIMAAAFVLSRGRLYDAIDILRQALVRLGVLRGKMRMVTDPPERDG